VFGTVLLFGFAGALLYVGYIRLREKAGHRVSRIEQALVYLGIIFASMILLFLIFMVVVSQKEFL
jgi:drug/metabolite transporter (DMT)-like permease